ncbi:hypothetical protein NBRC10512_007614 [Rhodotorula toruloides]|uniref:RHTO0S05e01816g1_1 n=2 Tax=Rhodotorula toruloides TaxID=5286 RepID=A0A061AT37_RHOTO|nr:uncharacterized protein RHTO_02410 [Rhodotorula toruloides NP11]EMS20794.1 hypothetical protein RHTO_02410 [Rhodotorula toruloides NP11]CDR40337.1 RHTO0S05e01816g1_1 [Rhodotorula toruloides]
MPISYITTEVTPVGSRSITPHLRRRSSVSASTTPSSYSSPSLSSRASYNERTGEIALPPSPPLRAWDDKSEKNALGLYDSGFGGKGAPLAWRTAPKGRAFALPRPYYTALALTAITLTFVFLISYLVPPASTYQPTSFISRIRTSPKLACDPYSSFGTLQVDLTDADRNQWMPTDPKCQPPHFLAKLREIASHQRHHTAYSRTSVSPADFDWLQNKTVLLIGDSISREHVENFCQLMGEESEIIRPSHPWAATSAPVRGATKAQHYLERPKRLNQRGFRVVRDASRPRVCFIPRFNFLLVSAFHYGLDQEDYWRESRMPQYSSPGLFEHRLMDQIQPLIANIRAEGRPTAPDYVEVTSGMWDLARWAEQDIVAGKSTEELLSQDRLTWYRFRVGQMMDKVRAAFPNAKAKVWRTPHYPLDQVAEFDYFLDKISSRAANASRVSDPPYFAHSRVQQIDRAVRSLVLPHSSVDSSSPASSRASPSASVDDFDVPHPEFRLNEWGTLLKGHQAHQLDRLHGDPLPGGYVWADIMLYELWRSQQGQVAR